MDEHLEHTLECTQLQHLDVVLGDLAANLDIDTNHGVGRQTADDAAELFGQRQHRLDGIGQLATLDVDGIGHQLASEREANRASDRDTRLLLRFVGRSAEVRGRHHVLQGEERGIRARFLGVHIQSSAGDTTFHHRGVQGRLVDDAPSGGVDDVHRRFHFAKGLLADQADRLRCLRQMHGEEIRFSKHVVEGHHADPELCCARGLDIGVVGNEAHTEGAQSLRNQNADPTQADDAHDLVGEFDTRVLRALPFTTM